jgi:hypothetical protein
MKGRTYRADGGKTEEGVKVTDSDKGADWYSGETSNVKKEAEQKTGFKKGGKVSNFGRGKMSEGMDKFEAMKKAKKVAKKDGGSCDGDKSMERMDKKSRATGGRAQRASGGAISGSRNPFAMAEKTSERPGFKGMKNIND